MNGLVGQHIKTYRVSARIGRGGMGIVYRALDLGLHRDVAIKVLNPELNDNEIAKRFRAEAMTVARLNHPGIARIYDFFEHGGQWMMVMEYLRGETLERMVERLGPLPAARAADLVLQTLAALGHAHSQGVVHRDLKPANLMLTESGDVKTMDFGIARVVGSEHLTNAGLMMGTPAFMAPEQVTGREVDARTDLYSLGLVFFYLLTGKLPFAGDTPMAMARSRVELEPAQVHSVRDGLPDWVQTILDRALAKKPDRRFQSAEQFDEALRHGLHGREADADQHTALAIGPLLATQPMPALADGVIAAEAAADVQPADARSTDAVRTSNARSPWIIAVVGALVLAAAATAGWAWLGGGASSPPTAAVVSPTLSATTTPTSSIGPAATPGPSAPPSPVASAASPSPTTTPTPGARARGAVADTLVAFAEVKLFVVNGQKLEEKDVVLNFVGGQVSLTPKNGGAALASLPIRQVTRATYAHAQDPVWDPKLAVPPAGVDYPGRSARHWLTLQSAAAIVVLRLDGQWREVLDALDARAALKVDRRN